MTRCAATALALVCVAVLIVGCAAPAETTYEGLTPDDPSSATVADEPGGVTSPPALRLELAWDGFAQPLHLTHAGDDSGRVFVVEKTGRIVAVHASGQRDEYLDISDQVSTGSERGLLSVAFSPDFAATGRLYIDYTRSDGATVVSRLMERDGVADPDSEEVLLTVPQPYANHNGGQLAFGPDEYLYVGLGDGGSGEDPERHGQDPTTLLGSILRIDVDVQTGYEVPGDNPFVQGGGAPEVWSYGLRNPWRFSFDTLTGDLWIADVGQNAWEEIDVERAGSPGGANYGWRVWEGDSVYEDGDPRPKSPVPPVHVYGRDVGLSVTGGFVYRGRELPDLRGWYLFGDYVSGHVWALDASQGSDAVVPLFETGLNISSFGEDEDGELYVVDFASGGVYAITAAD